MWSHLRGVATAQQRGCHSTRDSEDGPNLETTIRRRRSTERSIDSTNPCHRRRQRTAEARRCCQCTRFATCGADPRAVCECRAAQRECSNCCAGKIARIDHRKRLSMPRLRAIYPSVTRSPPTLPLAETQAGTPDHLGPRLNQHPQPRLNPLLNLL